MKVSLQHNPPAPGFMKPSHEVPKAPLGPVKTVIAIPSRQECPHTFAAELFCVVAE